MNYKIITFATLLCCGSPCVMAQSTKSPHKQTTKPTKDINPEDIDLKDVDALYHKNVQTSQTEGCAQQVTSMTQTPHGMLLQTTRGYLRLEILRKDVLHVSYGSLDEINKNKSYIVKTSAEEVPHEISDNGNQYTLATPAIKAIVNKADGHITFLDGTGKRLVSEFAGKARMNVERDSVCPYTNFQLSNQDAIYGLGQFRDYKMNLRNTQRELIQFNTQAAIPVIYSTGGWGLYWDNPTRTIYSDSNKGMSFRSDYGNTVEYYLFVGDNLDKLTAAFHSFTGKVPMMPYWALGYHQSRNRYHNRKEFMQIAKTAHEKNIPMSSIFIDYHYWGKYGTGAMKFDESLWPNVPEMLDSVRNAYKSRTVITMWPCFKPGTPNYNLMDSKGYILHDAHAIDGIVYDVFNPDARQLYRQMITPLIKLGVDGFFMDGPEPDHMQSFLPTQTYLGPARKVRNLYPLYNSANYYKAITAVRPSERPYMITRCATVSQHQYGTAVWSGDIPATWGELRNQVVAGLNFSAVGCPYWTTDIGGYSGGDPNDPKYRELFTRWFQYGTFCSIFRAHGRRYPGKTETPNEPWSYGPKAEKILTSYIDMRYKLLPYIYSLSAMTTQTDYNPMRLLAYDFAADKKTWDCKDEFMYGPAFLVCPVLEEGKSSRSVYLPSGHEWIDYWTGAAHKGGTSITADVPIEKIPLYVKAGSIIPTYNKVYGNEIAHDVPVRIDVYAGADGAFNYYEDDGHSINYKKGDYKLIPLLWDDNKQKLTIGKMEGSYAMGKKTFEIYIHKNGKVTKSKTIKIK